MITNIRTEHFVPAYALPAVGGPINSEHTRDPRCDIDRLQADQRTAWNWAIAHRVAVLSINADRNGAYLCVAPSPLLYELFGEECCWVHRHCENGMRTELWLGCIGHIRVFWREVKCVL